MKKVIKHRSPICLSPLDLQSCQCPSKLIHVPPRSSLFLVPERSMLNLPLASSFEDYLLGLHVHFPSWDSLMCLRLVATKQDVLSTAGSNTSQGL